jgi:hypothetical protein
MLSLLISMSYVKSTLIYWELRYVDGWELILALWDPKIGLMGEDLYCLLFSTI